MIIISLQLYTNNRYSNQILNKQIKQNNMNRYMIIPINTVNIKY